MTIVKIILIVAISAFFIYELVSLIRELVKERKRKKSFKESDVDRGVSDKE